MRRCVLLAGIVLMLSCHRKPATEGRLLAIEANLKSLRPVNGFLPTGDREVPFTAYFQQMDLQLVEEQPDDETSHQNRYYFHKGEMFYFRELRSGKLERQFVIDRSGTLQNTIPAVFPGSDYTLLKSRAVELKTAAVARAGRMFVFPLMRSPE